MNKLQKALSFNTLFSAISGICLISLHNAIATIFGTSNSTVFWVVGAGLVLFACTIFFEIKKQRPLAVVWIVIQDFLWVGGSLFILLTQPFNISGTGTNVIAVIALIVFSMGINQTWALAQTETNDKKGRKKLSFKRTINAKKSDVWKVISDVANYHQVAPNIDEVTIVSGKDEALVRRCSHGKDSWTETCSIWKEEKTYSFVVNTSAPDYPYPFSFLQGTWNIIEIDANHSQIEMIFKFKYKMKIINLMHPLMKIRFTRISSELLDNWQNILEK